MPGLPSSSFSRRRLLHLLCSLVVTLVVVNAAVVPPIPARTTHSNFSPSTAASTGPTSIAALQDFATPTNILSSDIEEEQPPSSSLALAGVAARRAAPGLNARDALMPGADAATKRSTSTTKRRGSSSKKTASSSRRRSTSATHRKSTRKSTGKSTTVVKTTKATPSRSTTRKVSSTSSTSIPAATLSSSGVHLLVQNDLNWATSDQHAGYLLVDAESTYSRASSSCMALSEELAIPVSGSKDLSKQLSYLIFKGTFKAGQSFWTGGQMLLTLKGTSGLYTLSKSSSRTAKYPFLCTQSVARGRASQTDMSAKTYVKVKMAGGSVVTGYRDALSFRFHAIPYANTPLRFAYSSVFTGSRPINAVGNGQAKRCPQNSGFNSTYAQHSEDCLLLNIWTNYLPHASAESHSASSSSDKSRRDEPLTQESVLQARATARKLRPIMLWVHGGGYTSGTGFDHAFDGGQIASRGDVVVVTINYRLGTLGFLPIDDSHGGNYGLQDIVTALKWLQQNAATFGGDAARITLFGQSAGANLIQYMLGNPTARGLFNNVIIQSPRPADQYNGAIIPSVAKVRSALVLQSLGCSKSASPLACLRGLPVSKFLSSAVYSSVTVDGTNVLQQQYALNGRGKTTNRVPMILGYMRDEQAALGYVPPSTLTKLSQAMINGGINARTRQIVLNNSDVFSTSIPHGVQNLTVGIESSNGTGSRCGIPATAYAAVHSGAFPDVWVYTQDQRSYQILDYDPNGVCRPPSSREAGNASSYYFCHSGDILPTFATPMYRFGRGDRDGLDLSYIRNQVDQWTSFARHSNPNPSSAYLRARGYSQVRGDPWPRLTDSPGTSGRRMISLGPVQKAVQLDKYAAQCDLIGNGLRYIVNGGATGDDYGG